MDDPASPSYETARVYIEDEIQHYRNIEGRAGWSSWVILAALGGITWLAVSIWEQDAVAPALLAQLCVAFSLPIDWWGSWFIPWLGGDPRPLRGKRFYFLSDAQDKRPALWFWAVRAFVLSGVVLAYCTQLGDPVRIILGAWYGCIGLVVLGVVGASYVDEPFNPHPDQSWRVRASSLVFQIALFVLLMRYYLARTPFQSSGQPAPELRLAALLAVGSCLLFALMLRLASPRVLNRLTDVRRRLAAGRIVPARAMTEVQLATGAMEGHSVVVRGLLELSDDLIHLGDVLAATEALATSLKPDAVHPNDARKVLDLMKEARQFRDRASRRRASVGRHIDQVSKHSPASMYLPSRRTQMAGFIFAMEKEYAELDERLNRLGSQLGV